MFVIQHGRFWTNPLTVLWKGVATPGVELVSTHLALRRSSLRIAWCLPSISLLNDQKSNYLPIPISLHATKHIRLWHSVSTRLDLVLDPNSHHNFHPTFFVCYRTPCCFESIWSDSFYQIVILCTTSIIFGTCMWFALQSVSRTSLVYAPTVVFACMSSLLTLITPMLLQELTGNDKVSDPSQNGPQYASLHVTARGQ